MAKLSVHDALHSHFSEPYRDALWGHVYLTHALLEITRQAEFVRLHRIAQLGPAHLVYPGAVHTRAAHSIGVYHIARRMLTSLCDKGADAFLTGEGARSFLCAALLHDIGHFPYAHSLKELSLETHETLGAKIVETSNIAKLIAKAGGDPSLVAAIINTAQKTEGAEALFYRKLLSGSIDPDKLDYLNRDARFVGVPYGIQDVDFILSRLFPHKERGFIIDSKAIASVESVLFSKYLMYRTVYWHKNVRSATALMKKTLKTALEAKILAPEELYNLDDAGLFALLEKKLSSAKGDAAFWLRAALSIKDGKLFACVEEAAFNGDNSADAAALQQRFAEKYGGNAIIDVPEEANFETGLWVSDEDCFFEESSSVFGRDTVRSFARALRCVRVFVAA